MDAATCDASKKPTVTEADNKACNEELCDPYIWREQNGVCSVTCGKGNPVFPTKINFLPFRNLKTVSLSFVHIDIDNRSLERFIFKEF